MALECLSVCLCVYTYTQTCTYTYIKTHICIHTHTCEHTHTQSQGHVWNFVLVLAAGQPVQIAPGREQILGLGDRRLTAPVLTVLVSMQREVRKSGEIPRPLKDAFSIPDFRATDGSI